MKTSLSFLLLLLFCLSANGQSVGINTINPDPSAALDVQSFDQGILVPRLKENARLNIQNPATALLVYDIDNLRFYTYDGTKWLGLSTTDAFVNEFGIVRNDGDLGDDIFLFAADQLPGSGSDDTLMMFHTPTGAFRSGRPSSNFWIVDSLGNFSFAAGAGVKASGDYSASVGTGNQSIGEASFTAGIGNDATDSYATAIGRMNDATGFGSLATGSENLASGQYATAMGNLTEASGNDAIAMGSQTKAIGSKATAMGIQSEAIGSYSTAMGRTTKAGSRTSTAMGRFNVGGGHPTSWQEEDPLLEVGNGSDASNLHNAMTILKNGKTGIGTATPDTSLSVIGVSRAAFDESETNFIEMSHGGGNAFINAAGTGNIDIRHEGTNIMTIAQNQRVGIGTNSPDTDFSVIGKVRAAIQSSENEYTEIFHGGDNGYINTVGDGNLQFRHDDNTLMSLNDGGDLFINRELTLGSANTNTDYTFPAIDGVANQFLKTDGNGILNWINDDHDGTFVLDNNSATLILGGNSNAHNFVFGGNFPFPNTNYSETIFMFGNSKASFRTGILDNSDNWQKSESGMASFGAGRNVIASGDYSAVFGNLSEASGLNSFAAGANTIASGNSSTAFGSASMASGDESLATGRNAEASGNYSTAMGDQTIASGIHSIAIGLDSEASGVGSIALAGAKSNSYQCVSIGYGNDGGSDPDSWEPFDPVFEVGIITAIQNNIPIGKSAFTVLKNGDVGIMRSSPLHPLHVGTDGTNGNGAFLTTGGLWANGSSRTFKHRFEQVDKIEILEKLVKLDILKWEYKESEEGTHLGPIAEDFYETFGLGSDEKYISTADADGVALAAIQGLYQENQELKNELESQKKEINDLKELVSKLIELNSKE